MESEQYELFEEVVCASCGETIPRLTAFIVEKHTDGKDIEVPFCNESEANDYYLEHLRLTGL